MCDTLHTEQVINGCPGFLHHDTERVRMALSFQIIRERATSLKLLGEHRLLSLMPPSPVHTAFLTASHRPLGFPWATTATVQLKWSHPLLSEYLCVHTHVCVCVCIHAWAHVCTHIEVNMCVHVCVCCAYVCVRWERTPDCTF